MGKEEKEELLERKLPSYIVVVPGLWRCDSEQGTNERRDLWPQFRFAARVLEPHADCVSPVSSAQVKSQLSQQYTIAKIK